MAAGGDLNQNQSVTFSTNVTTVAGNGNVVANNGALKSALKHQQSSELLNGSVNGIRNNKTEILISADHTSVISNGNLTQPSSLMTCNSSSVSNINGSYSNGGCNGNNPYRNDNGGSTVAMKAEPRVNVISRPRPKSVAVPNPSSSGNLSFTIYFNSFLILNFSYSLKIEFVYKFTNLIIFSHL